jgi:hypothetical protein
MLAQVYDEEPGTQFFEIRGFINTGLVIEG